MERHITVRQQIQERGLLHIGQRVVVQRHNVTKQFTLNVIITAARVKKRHLHGSGIIELTCTLFDVSEQSCPHAVLRCIAYGVIHRLTVTAQQEVSQARGSTRVVSVLRDLFVLQVKHVLHVFSFFVLHKYGLVGYERKFQAVFIEREWH